MQIDEIQKLQAYTKNLQLLYVEDNEDTRVATRRMFEQFFDNVIVAVDGQDGFDKFLKYNPDIIFTDVNMPNMNGLQMIDKINNHTSKHIPILVLSAYGESKDLLNAIKVGVDGYLLKPFTFEGFVDELQRIISKKYKSQNELVEINSNYTWSKEAKKLYYLSKEITLTKNEILLLELMTSNINLIYSDELIMEQIWLNSESRNISNLKNLFKRLNAKLSQKLIKNIYSVGYSFV